MAENTIFTAGLEIVPKFDRNKVSTQLKSISQQMNAESKKLSDAIKIGVKIDTSDFMKATSQYAKAIEGIGKALDEENKKGFNGKNTRLFSIMEQAKTTREEVGKVFSEYNKMIKATAKPSNLSQDAYVKLGNLQNVVSLPENDYKQVKNKIKAIKDSVEELNNLKGEVGLSDKQVVQVEKALIRADKTLYKLQNSFSSLSRVKLLNFEPKTAQQANMAMSELKSRQQQLNISTKTGANAYNEMEMKIRQLYVAKTKLTNSSRSEIQAIDGVTQATYKQNAALHQLKILARQYLGVYAIVRVAQNIRDITGEFELQRVALGAIIQDQHKANQLFEEAKAQALESPFQVKDVVTYMKQLSAFQINKNEISETTKRLADISAGLGVDMSRIILAYGQVRAASVLRGQELRQFTEAGIPLVEKLAQKFTLLNGKLVTTSDVFGLISERKVPFEMVRDVLWDMTDAGGSFFDMQKKQAQTIKGSYSNLIDELQVAYDKIGQANYGVLKGTIDVSRQIIRLGSDNMNIITGLGVAFLTARAGTLMYNNALTEQGKIIMNNVKAYEKSEYQRIALNNLLGDKKENTRGFLKNEKINVDTAKYLIENKQINSQLATRLLLYNKLDSASIAMYKNAGLLSETAVNTMRKLNLQIAIGNKAYGTMRLGILRLSAGFIGLAASVKAFTVSLLTNPMTWIMVVAAAIPALISKLTEASKAAEELKKTTRLDINENMFKLDKNLNSISPNVKKDIEDINKLIAQGNNEDAKKKLNSEEYTNKLKGINDVLMQSVSENEFLNKLIKERIKDSNNQLEINKQINETIKDYKVIMAGMKSTPTLLSDIINESGAIDAGLAFIENYYSIKRELEALIKQGTIDRSLSSELDKAFEEQNYQKLYELVNKNKSLFSSTLLFYFNETYKETDNLMGKLSVDTKKTFNTATEDGAAMFKAYNDELQKNGTEKTKNFLSLFNKKYYLNVEIKLFEEEDVAELSSFIANINKQLNQKGIWFNFKNAPERKDWGIDEAKNLIKESISKDEEELKRAQDAYDRKGFVKSLSLNREEDKKYIDELRATLKGEKEAFDYFGGSLKENKGKGKTALELAVERIKSDIDNIKELKKRYDELIKYSSDATAKEESLALFMGLDGKSSLPKEIQKGYSDEAYMSYLENIKKELEKKFKGAKKGVEISKINAEIKKIDLEIRDVKVENLKRVSDKILQDVQEELNKTKARIDLFEDMFKATGDYNLSQSLTNMLEGVGSMDMFDEFKTNLNKVIEGAFTSEKDIDLVKRLKLDINNAAIFTDFDKIMKELPEPAQKALETILKNYKDTTKSIIQEVLNGVERYKDAEQQKVDIAIKAGEQIEKINKMSILQSQKDQLIDRAKAGVQQQQAKIMLQQFKDSEWYSQVFANLETTSEDVMRTMREQLINLKNMTKDSIDPQNMKELVTQIEKIDKILAPKTYSWKDAFIPNKQEIFEAKLEVDSLSVALEEAVARRDKLQKKILNPNTPQSEKIKIGADMDLEAIIITNLLNMLAAAQKAQTEASEEQTKATITFKEQIDFLGNKLSEIQSLTSGTTTLVQGLKKAFKGKESEEFAKVMEEINNTISIGQAALSILTPLMTLYSVVAGTATAETKALTKAMLANPVFWLVAGIMALVGALKLYQAIADKAANREIENMNTALENSERIIKDMENALSNLAGNEYFQNIASQIDEIEKQASYAQRQLDAEKSKTKPDEDKVNEYTESVEKYTQAARDKQRELIESLWGDLKSMTEDLINVWLDAYKSGANTFNAIKKKFGEMIEDMIVKTIAAQVIKKNLEGVFKYVEQMLDDGMVSVSETETLTQMVLDASQKANQSMSALAPLFTSLANTFNSSLSSMGSISEGISGASEESVSILAGYWLSHLNVTTSMAYDVAAIRQAIENRVQANIDNALISAPEQPININEIMYQQLMHLTAIESNTAMNLVKLSQFYDKFSQVVVPNPNGDTAFALKTLN